METDLPKRESSCSLQLNIYLCLFWCALSLVFPSSLRHQYQFPLTLQTLSSSRRVTQYCFGHIFCYLTWLQIFLYFVTKVNRDLMDNFLLFLEKYVQVWLGCRHFRLGSEWTAGPGWGASWHSKRCSLPLWKYPCAVNLTSAAQGGGWLRQSKPSHLDTHVKHLRLDGFCVCLEDDWSDLSQAVLNKPWTCPQGWEVFGSDSAKTSLCMFDLGLLITFEKCGKTLLAQHVLWHSTKSLVEMLSSSPVGDQVTMHIWDFLKSYPVMLFPVCLTGPWSFLFKSPTGCRCTTKCNRPVTIAWLEARGMLWFIPTWLNSFTPKNKVATPSLPLGMVPRMCCSLHCASRYVFSAGWC